MGTDTVLAVFAPACEYFLFLLNTVEWPKSWKAPLIARVHALFPALSGVGGKEATLPHTEQKELILQYSTTRAQIRLDDAEFQHPEPGHEFFERHRSLYGWVMQNDEPIAQEYVFSQIPAAP